MGKGEESKWTRRATNDKVIIAAPCSDGAYRGCKDETDGNANECSLGCPNGWD